MCASIAHNLTASAHQGQKSSRGAALGPSQPKPLDPRDNRKPGHLFREMHDQTFGRKGDLDKRCNTEAANRSMALVPVIGWLRRNPGHGGVLGSLPKREWNRLLRNVPETSLKRYVRGWKKAGLIRFAYDDPHNPRVILSYWDGPVEKNHLARTRATDTGGRRRRRQKAGQMTVQGGGHGGPPAPSEEPQKAPSEAEFEMSVHLTAMPAKQASSSSSPPGACAEHPSSKNFKKDVSSPRKRPPAQPSPAPDTPKIDGPASSLSEEPQRGESGAAASSDVPHWREGKRQPGIKMCQAGLKLLATVPGWRPEDRAPEPDSEEPALQPLADAKPQAGPKQPSQAEQPRPQLSPQAQPDPLDTPATTDMVRNLLARHMDLSCFDARLFNAPQFTVRAILYGWDGMQQKLRSGQAIHPAKMLHNGAMNYQKGAWKRHQHLQRD